MLKYFTIFAMVVILLIFSSLGISKQPEEIIEEVVTQPKKEKEKQVIKVRYENLNAKAKKQVQCLASNIYFEARSETVRGQIAVAFVTLNRVQSDLFPDNICDVVKQKTRGTCQFSWYCESRPKKQYYTMKTKNEFNKVYHEILDVAVHVYANYEKLFDPTYGSLFYHANYVRPNWRNLEKVAIIDTHIFYRIKENHGNI